MTNWPNIQEYRNFEAKFINDPTNNLSINSTSESSSILKNDFKSRNSLDELTNTHQYQNLESKTVRCVIKKDFEEAFKKLDRGDGFEVNQETAQPKPQEAVVVNQELVDQIRLQNHLKWKKQKAEEYLHKKEAERMAQQKKKEEELRLERMKKLKEKEREEKLREWQEQKAREKEERKKDKMVMRVLEEELKVTPTVDKEKLLGEWVKLKDKQRHLEAEKKAELQRKQEENRELRRNLAKLSYKHWKESIKGRMMTLPKNGYQIFGPKPAPVVKEDWNHNFTSCSPRNQNIGVRNTKSNTTTSITFRPALKELEHFSKNVFYLGNLKTRNPSFYHLRTAKSGLNLSGNSELSQRGRFKLPLKELQQKTIDSHKISEKSLKNGFRKTDDLISQYLRNGPNTNTFSNLAKEKYTYFNHSSLNFLNYLSKERDQNQCVLLPQSKKLANLIHDLPNNQVLPNKKKLDLYLNAESESAEEFSPQEEPEWEKEPPEPSNEKLQTEEKKELKEKKIFKPPLEIKSRETFRSRTHIGSNSLQREAKTIDVNVNSKKNAEGTKSKVCRKSRSCEKPVKKCFKDPSNVKYSSSSKSLKVNEKFDDGCKKFGAAKSMPCIQKRKSKKKIKPETPIPSMEKIDKKTVDSGMKNHKKLKKNGLMKSPSFSDSPYDSKNSLKSTSKVKGSRKVTKDGETKSDGAGRSRKLSTTKI